MGILTGTTSFVAVFVVTPRRITELLRKPA